VTTTAAIRRLAFPETDISRLLALQTPSRCNRHAVRMTGGA
jgi:hypothetical protein